MRLAMVILIAVSFTLPLAAQTPPYPLTPDWISADQRVATGGAFADINGDGWLDFVVANGNDIRQERLSVYYNNGDGTLPAQPSWESSDTAYNGHLDVADVNGDGWLDVAVAHLGEFNTFAPVARLYLNNNGTLSAMPDWVAHIDGNAFACAFGDMNNDGRPDLAVGTGWSYSPMHFYRNFVYLNINGMLEATPSWQSDDEHHYMGVRWTDADDDGWLDLIGVGSDTNTWIYRNLGGALETTASWRTTDNARQDSIMAAVGDVNGDGLRDLFVTDNVQILGGTGRFRQYNGQPGGFFSTTPDWFYYNNAHDYGSAVALADINADGHLDLATGAWWSQTRIFYNQDGAGFGSTPTWTSTPSSVIEKIVFGDIDKNALRTVTTRFAAPPAAQHLFYLPYQPIQDLVRVARDGVTLTPDQYTYSREDGWIVVAPQGGDVEVEYTVSSRLDMGITNWDSSRGNYLYYNVLVALGDANCDGFVDNEDIDPFVLLLTDPAGYAARFPFCDGQTFCDMNGDGFIDNEDIDPFVAAITNP